MNMGQQCRVYEFNSRQLAQVRVVYNMRPAGEPYQIKMNKIYSDKMQRLTRLRKMRTRTVKFSHDSYMGINRICNKDGVLMLNGELYSLVAVFDGVSSAIDSDKAVKIAIEFIENNHMGYSAGSDFNLSKMMYNLNKLLIDCTVQEPFTTCSLMHIPYDLDANITYSNIGDSRIYAVTPQFIDKLTTDDSDKYHKNVLIKYLGKEDLNESDFEESVYRGEATRFLLCSDGFYNIFEGSNKALLDIHYALNINHSFYIRDNIKKVIAGHNSDDATYVLVRCNYV